MADAGSVAPLVRKYAEILRLRHAQAGEVAPPREAMTALALEFPGALREADQLPLAELEARLAALQAAVDDPGAVATWMTVTLRFHALARGALSAKRWLAGRRRVDPALLGAFEAEVDALPYPIDARAWGDELAALATPPEGRVTGLVFARLARELEVPVEEVRRVVFPARRAP